MINAFSEGRAAAPGSRQPHHVLVSVTDAAGNPVTALATHNFKVDPMIVGPAGALLDVVEVAPGRLPGFYLIDVRPAQADAWREGVYIFAVAVETEGNQGQTLATVLTD
jgi:hypothetical protein